jgi:hypothetical protein
VNRSATHRKQANRADLVSPRTPMDQQQRPGTPVELADSIIDSDSRTMRTAALLHTMTRSVATILLAAAILGVALTGSGAWSICVAVPLVLLGVGRGHRSR